MKRKKIINLILIVIILALLYFVITITYSKYLTQTDNSINTNISNWNIKINNQNITEDSNFSNTLVITYIPNENIAEGVIVPTSIGYFDIELDSHGTDLPFQYVLSIDSSESVIPDLKILGYTLNNSNDNNDDTINNSNENVTEETLTTNDTDILNNLTTIVDNNISEIIYPTDETQNRKYTIYFSWDDSEDNQLNNSGDVNASKTTPALVKINVNVDVSQYLETSSEQNTNI